MDSRPRGRSTEEGLPCLGLDHNQLPPPLTPDPAWAGARVVVQVPGKVAAHDRAEEGRAGLGSGSGSPVWAGLVPLNPVTSDPTLILTATP